MLRSSAAISSGGLFSLEEMFDNGLIAGSFRLGLGGLLLVPLIIIFLYHEDDSQVETAGAFTIVLTNYVGDVACSMTGSLAAGMEGMDLLGCVVVGFATALGGGTFRDLLLGRQPIGWLVAWDEALLCVSVRPTPTYALSERPLVYSDRTDAHSLTPHNPHTGDPSFILIYSFIGGRGDLLFVAAALPPLQVELLRRMDVLARRPGPRRLRLSRCVQRQPR